VRGIHPQVAELLYVLCLVHHVAQTGAGGDYAGPGAGCREGHYVVHRRRLHV